MKLQITSLFVAALMAGSATAHSWLDCVDSKDSNYDEAKADPSKNLNKGCNGYPRNKASNGDWIAESSNYAWNLNGPANTEGLACHPSQASPIYPQGVPMTTAVPGQHIKMRFWGNGHTRWDIGSPNHRDPGLIRIYWAGRKETDFKSKSDFTEKNWMKGMQANFSADTITYINGNTMNEKANYFNLVIPEKIENGRHSMAWVWAWDRSIESNGAGFNPETDYDKEWTSSWSTCFDIEIKDSDFTGPSYTSTSTSTSTNDESDACATSTCLKANMPGQSCTGSDCPPCWYKSSTAGSVGCFDYKPGTTTCPWGGAYDCKIKKQTRRALKHERSPFV